MRDHAHVEDHIKRLKDSGLERFPFTNLDANRAWMQLVCLAADLVRWLQQLCCTGELATAEPKRMRWTLWHTPARIVRRAGRDIVRIIDGWPTTNDLLHAHQRITALCCAQPRHPAYGRHHDHPTRPTTPASTNWTRSNPRQHPIGTRKSRPHQSANPKQSIPDHTRIPMTNQG